MNSRRTFLKVGAASVFGTLINSMALASSPNKKALVFLWMGGGPSSQELWLPPDDSVPEAYRSITGKIPTSISGHYIGATFPEMAQQLHRCVVVKSFSHPNPNHGSATHLLLTSRKNSDDNEGTPQLEPSFGSMISSIFGANSSNGMPNYIALDKIQYDGAAWLGPSYNPYQNSKDAIDNLKPRTSLVNKRELLSSLDKMQNCDTKGFMKVWEEYREQTYGLIYGTAKDAFEISNEPKEILEKYGNTSIGKNLLLARRLIENGTRIVNLHFGGWDMHGDIEAGFKNLGPQLDKAMAAFISEIYDRNMNEEVMLVVVGEFGRTKLNSGLVNGIQYKPGRDHWPTQSSLLIAGGKYDMGRTIGTTDKYCYVPKDGIKGPSDLLATIFDHFSIDLHTQKVDNSGRPRYLVENGTCIL